MTRDQLEKLWAKHLAGEFTTKDVDATLATMVDDAYVNHMPVNTGGKGKDAATVATTTAAGAGIGAIADGGKGAGIGAGIGGAAGLAAVLLSRGPDAQLARGSSMDLMLERDLHLDADQIHYTHVGQPNNTVILQQPQSN